MDSKKNETTLSPSDSDNALESFFRDVGMTKPHNAEITAIIHPDTGRIDAVMVARKGVTGKLQLPLGSIH